MNDVTNYNSIRNTKVMTGNIERYQSMRIFNDKYIICPLNPSEDRHNSYTPGCFTTQLELENSQRPKFSTYLDIGSIKNSNDD